MPHIYALSLLFMVGLAGSVQASGGIYKWVDQNGITQYSQTPPPKNAKNSQTVRVSKHVPVDVREGRAQGMVDAATLQAYTSPSQGVATATNVEQPAAAPTADAATGSTISPPAVNPAPVNNATPAQSSLPVPITTARPDQL